MTWPREESRYGSQRAAPSNTAGIGTASREAETGDNAYQPRSQAFVASGWVSCIRGTMLGFVDLELPSGLVLHGCTVHQDNGKRWVGLPGRPQIGKDGKQLISPKTGKPSWSACVSIDQRERRERFMTAAIAAIDRLRAREPP